MLKALATALVLAASVATVSIPHTFDVEIEAASEKWLPSWDADWYKAQLFQESRLDPTAKSSVGASGIAQFMPATWAEVSKSLNYGTKVSPLAAKLAIEAGAYYDAKLSKEWRNGNRPEDEVRKLTFASYNAGTGNILAAQRMCLDKTHGVCRNWDQIKPYLKYVTGDSNANQTITYVERIETWHNLLKSKR